MSIDIIIPIYNAYEYTVECVKSVLRHTDMKKHRLVLINDKSPDERIVPYLNQLIASENVQVLHNETNLGFVGTVNRGMSLSQNDVVLLNSDTEVTAGWLDKIEKAAYLNESVATVTPLTNNGTICSIPRFCEDNEIPKSFTLEEYAQIVERTSLKLYPTLPTAVGFCMFIKREVINKIGLFDAEAFGKGYGEENDFCCRVIEHGYTNILCDDTFIYHKGSTSFLGNKEEYVRKNIKVLNNRYPYYDLMIQKFIQDNPLKSIHDNIDLQIKLRNGKKNVLFVLHNDFIKGQNHPIGGTEYHTKDVIDHLQNTNAFVMYIKGREICLEIIIDGQVTPLNINLTDRIGNTEYSNYHYKKEVGHILDYFEINCIHIQHLRTHTMDIAKIAKERQIPIYMTIHDFYVICPKVTLLDSNEKYCLNTRGKEMCQKCIKECLGINEYIIEDWNQKCYSLLKQLDGIFVPSESVKEIIEDYYKSIIPDFDLDIKVREHGVDNKERSSYKKEDGIFRIAFMGGLAPYKGSELVHDLIKKCKNSNIEWHILGNIGDTKLDLLQQDNLKKHGRYERDKATDLLVHHSIDLVCIFSMCPETYSYTVSEAIMANKPLLVNDIGALGERVKGYNCGWTVPVGLSAQQILCKIEEIMSDKEAYNEKVRIMNGIKLPSKEEVSQFYEKLYIKGKEREIKSEAAYNKKILEIYKLTNAIASNSHEQLVILNLQEENEQLKNMLNAIQGTIGWRCLNYMRVHFPFLNKIGKKIVYLVASIVK